MAQGLLGGVLPAIFSGADQLKRGVYGLLTNPQEQAQRAAQSLLQSRAERQALMGQAFANPDRPFQVTNQVALGQLGSDVLMGELGIAPVGMIAYHGTPHLIKDRFDISKVGTGEGAQSYGHGMYFAEAPSVAKTYAEDNLRYPSTPLGDAQLFLKQNLFDYDAAKKDVMKNLDFIEKSQKGKIGYETEKQKYQEVLNILEKGNVPKLEGNLYKVDIPDSQVPNMLDWDKPLSQQPKEVIENLKKLNDPYINEAITTQPKISKDGEYWTYMGNTYGSKSEALNDAMPHKIITGYTGLGESPAEVSNMLNSVGIKGVKYLDQGSRGMTTGIGFNAPKYTAYDPNFGGHDFNSLKEAEEFVKNNPSFELLKPTSNFVVFDPTDVKILERNDQPIESLLGN